MVSRKLNRGKSPVSAGLAWGWCCWWMILRRLLCPCVSYDPPKTWSRPPAILRPSTRLLRSRIIDPVFPWSAIYRSPVLRSLDYWSCSAILEKRCSSCDPGNRSSRPVSLNCWPAFAWFGILRFWSLSLLLAACRMGRTCPADHLARHWGPTNLLSPNGWSSCRIYMVATPDPDQNDAPTIGRSKIIGNLEWCW
jgi:hypothetical protein